METHHSADEKVIASKTDDVEVSTTANRKPVNGRERVGSRPGPGPSWLLLPREHGAWGMVSLPFLAAAAIAPGDAFTINTAAAFLAVFSTFLLRDPVVVLRRIYADPGRPEAAQQQLTARRSLLLCLGGLALSGAVLLRTLPAYWVLLLGSSGLILVIASVLIAVERVQRQILSQLLGIAALTGSCLPAYLAVHGQLDWRALTIWAMSAVHSLASVLIVRARLETILSHRRATLGPASRRFFRTAVGVQLALGATLLAMALSGYPWPVIPFLFPGALHAWELWQCRRERGQQLSMHRLGWLQLSASIAFYCLLVLVFRYPYNS